MPEEQSTFATRQVRTLVAVMALDIGGMLPVALCGALVVDMALTIGVSPDQLAVLVSAFFLTGSVTAMFVGVEIDRVGPLRAALLSSFVTCCALGAVHLADSRIGLTGVLMLAGAALSVTMPATNAVLTQEIPLRHRAFAISAKQSAVPLALMVAGLTLPLVAPALGWRWTFTATAVFPLVGALLLPRGGPVIKRSTPVSRSLGWSAQRNVLGVGACVLLASLLPGAITGFLALALITAGATASHVAVLFIVGNSVGILVRLVSGYVVDRAGGDGYRLVALMMLAGAVGAALLTLQDTVALSIGAVLALGLGWGWTGLTHFMVVRARPASAGAASAVVQSGGMLGSALGPLLMRGFVPVLGVQNSWLVVAALAAAAGVLIAMFPREPAETTA